MPAAKDYTFRAYTKDDIAFIQHSWAVSYFEGSGAKRVFKASEFHKYHRPIRDRILAKPTIAIIMAVAPDDPNLIIGYIIVEKPDNTHKPSMIMHYIYVKIDFSKLGIGRDLIEAAIPPDYPVAFTHMTKCVRFEMKRKKELYLNFTYTPHII